MRQKLAALLLIAAPVFAACRSGSPGAPADARLGTGGATSSRVAAESFLAAARSQDLQAMSLIWGTAEGPARATMDRAELEKRELVMMCYLRHDSYRIVEEAMAANGQQRVSVDLTQGTVTRRTHLVTTPAKNGAWYVLSADLEPLRDLCAGRP